MPAEQKLDENIKYSTDTFELFAIVQLLLAVKWKIIRNVFIGSTLAVILALIMPLTFRSQAVIMPPTSDSGLNIASALSALPFGNLLSGNDDGKAMIFKSILESRKVKTAVVEEFDLMTLYDSEFMEDAIETLDNNSSVEINEDGTIQIAFLTGTSWFHPQDEVERAKYLSRDVTNYYVTILDEANRQLNSEKAKNHREFIERRYEINKLELKKAEDALNYFQRQNNAIALEEQTKAAIDIAASIKAEILANEVKTEILGMALNQDHPDVVALKRGTELLQAQFNNLNRGVENDYLLPKFGEVADLGLEYLRLKRDVEVQNQIFIFLTQQYEEAKISEAKDTPTLQVLDHASLPERKYKPSRAKIAIIGFMLSLIGSIYGYYFLDRWKTIVHKNDAKKD
jgi:tyrosine-protein kinase Etk/Wzc